MKLFFVICVKWPITSTTVTKRNTVKKENLTNKKVFLTYKKGLLPYKQDLLTCTKKDLLAYIKNPRQIATANSHGKFPWQFPATNIYVIAKELVFKSRRKRKFLCGMCLLYCFSWLANSVFHILLWSIYQEIRIHIWK